MNLPKVRLPNPLTGLVAFLLACLLFLYFRGYDNSISWQIQTRHFQESFTAHTFHKGLFNLEVSAERFSAVESFLGGPIESHTIGESLLLILILSGICLTLAGATFLPRFSFIVINGLFIFFVLSLQLQDVGILGTASLQTTSVILLLTYLVPAYILHAFYRSPTFWWRVTVFAGLTVLLWIISPADPGLLREHFFAHSYLGLAIVTFLFILLIAEENVFAILFLITRTKGGEHNERHFAVFSLVYLGALGLHYAKKSGLLSIQLTFFDPYILLALSAGVALWSLWYKKELFQGILDVSLAKKLFAGLSLVSLSFIILSIFRGNDAIYEGFHYLIIYAHLGFGVFFFFYILLNFISPLSQGYQVYKIAYKEQNFPYISARLGGLVAIAAFYFLSNQEPLRLIQAGGYNYLGVMHEQMTEPGIATGYYQQGSVFGHDNHFSNYKLGHDFLTEQKFDEANYRFRRATLRFPSAYSYVNFGATAVDLGRFNEAVATLETGLLEFPDHQALRNNLGLLRAQQNPMDSPFSLFAGSSQEKEGALLTNYWFFKQNPDSSSLIKDYGYANLPARTNILNWLITGNINVALPLDTGEQASADQLLPYLNNYLLYSASYADDLQDFEVSETIRSEQSLALIHAKVLNAYGSGHVNRAMQLLDRLTLEAGARNKGRYLDEMGLLALDQQALPVALELFERSIESGMPDARLHKVITLLEMARFDDALDYTSKLLEYDSSFLLLRQTLGDIIEQKPSPFSDLYYPYYTYDVLSLDTLESVIHLGNDQFVQIFYRKISREMLARGEFQRLLPYLEIFEGRIDPATIMEIREIVSVLTTGKTGPFDGPLTEILATGDSSEVEKALLRYGSQNAFNVGRVLATARLLDSLSPHTKYDLLVQAINIDGHQPLLLKEYILAAVQLRLTDYAEEAIQKLATMIPEAEFIEFQKLINRERQLLQDQQW